MSFQMWVGGDRVDGKENGIRRLVHTMEFSRRRDEPPAFNFEVH